MDNRRWLDKYSTDCKLKYQSRATRDNYISCVRSFLEKFSDYREPKEIPTQEITAIYYHVSPQFLSTIPTAI